MLNKKRRRTVSPRNLRKRSDYMREYEDTVKVPGERVLIPTGYRVSSFKNGSFETFYEVMLAGTSTNRLRHLWVLAGQGFLEIQRPEESSLTKRLIPGDHVSIPRGSSFRVATTSQQTLEMIVTQQAKYEAKLEVLEELETARETPAADLAEPSLHDRMTSVINVTPRRGSKAAQQQVATRKERGREGGGHPPLGAPQSGGGDLMGFVQGKNPRPTGGKLSAEGAG
jgi:mannose-6-phosphate isomerase-like protein (cupin superfamily)